MNELELSQTNKEEAVSAAVNTLQNHESRISGKSYFKISHNVLFSNTIGRECIDCNYISLQVVFECRSKG